MSLTMTESVGPKVVSAVLQHYMGMTRLNRERIGVNEWELLKRMMRWVIGEV